MENHSLQMSQEEPGRGQEVSHQGKKKIIIVLTKIGTGGKVFRSKVESELERAEQVLLKP